MNELGGELVEKLAYVYVLSLLPSIEGRYAVLTGVGLGAPPLASFAAATLGVATLSALLPSALPLVDRLAQRLAVGWEPVARLARLYLRYVESARRRASRYADTYGALGLVVFVAIPLPATGVWTGSIAAHVLGLKRGRARAVLLAGGLLSNMLALLAAYGLLELLG
ncbi:MAG: COG2426 family protein [Thermoproteota archaeon]